MTAPEPFEAALVLVTAYVANAERDPDVGAQMPVALTMAGQVCAVALIHDLAANVVGALIQELADLAGMSRSEAWQLVAASLAQAHAAQRSSP